MSHKYLGDPMEKVIQYAEKNFNQFVEKLKTLVRIPSISLSVYPKEEVEKSAKAVASLLKEEGLEKTIKSLDSLYKNGGIVNLEDNLYHIQKSLSWKFTSPIRKFIRIIRNIFK
jgi:hypothetical protein